MSPLSRVKVTLHLSLWHLFARVFVDVPVSSRKVAAPSLTKVTLLSEDV
ncbi:MAG: hypothetical protein LBF22_14795 [Deltaproteobacteria bacterium]|nr:hypothetical protein [Deltaproteobacteria bacterium]